jgi:hypothetical protein
MKKEKNPPTPPLKRKKQEKKNLSTRARVRVWEISPAIDLPEWLKLGQNGTLPKNAKKRLFKRYFTSTHTNIQTLVQTPRSDSGAF